VNNSHYLWATVNAQHKMINFLQNVHTTAAWRAFFTQQLVN